MAFEVSGKSEKGIVRYGIIFVVFLLMGPILLLYFSLEEGFHPFWFFFPITFSLISLVFFKWMRDSKKIKTIHIEDGSIKYLVEGKEKTIVHIKDVTEVSTVRVDGKVGREGFRLWNKKEIVLQCGGLQDLELMKLIQAFNEILKYKKEYNFEVRDTLNWKGKEKLSLIQSLE